MGRPLTDYDRIAIAEIIIYSFFLVGGVILCLKHGFFHSSGWRFIIILALARLIGSSLLLASINDPTNLALYIGWLTLNGVGFGPLILTLLGLLSRLFDSINRKYVVVKPLHLRFIQILMLLAMILLVVGGTTASYQVTNGQSKITYNSESKTGAGLMIAVLALLLLTTFIAFRHQGQIAQGETRILIAVVASLPFIIVRLIYTCVLILGNKTQTVWLYLGAGVLMEIIVVFICQVVGFSLEKVNMKAPEQWMLLKERDAIDGQ